MRKPALLLLCLVCCLGLLPSLQAQTLYSEPFDTPGEGAVGGSTVSITPASNGQWSVTGDLSGLTASSDWLQTIAVSGNTLLEARDVDNEVCFQSSAIDISSAGSVDISIDFSETGTHETSDYIDVILIVDGVETQIPSFNGLGDASHTLVDDFAPFTLTETGISGSSLVIKVCFLNGAGSERYRMDNVLVEAGSTTPPPPPVLPAAVINEIHYNPSQPDDDYEFVELYNPGTTPVSLAGWTLTDGEGTFTFPSGASIAADEYIVVAANAATYSGNGYQVFEWPGNLILSNGGDQAILRDASSTLIDEVSYDDGNGWPTAADGSGPSLELNDPTLDNSLPASWSASSGNGGTPGAANSAFTGAGCTLQLSLDEALCESVTAGTTGDTYAAFVAFTGGTGDVISITPNSGTLSALSDDPDAVADGLLLIEGIAEGTDLELTVSSTNGCSFTFTVPAPACVPPAPVVINEIHYNGLTGGADPDEFIELLNIGTDPVDLSGYTFTSGVTFTFPAGAMIMPGEYVVLAVDAALFEATYGCAPDYEFGGGLSNGGETVRLESGDGTVIDEVPYDDGSGWPTAADGNGPSLELLDPASDNSNPASWTTSLIDGGTPGADNQGIKTGCGVNAPSNLTLTYNVQFLPELTWMDNSSNEDGFMLERSIAGGPFMPVASQMGTPVSIGADQTSYTDTVLVFGQQVTYRVKAFNATDVSPYSNEVSFAQPATVLDLDLSFDCYDVAAGELVWNVNNPNPMVVPGIYAQWWSMQRDTVFNLPGDNSFRTMLNAQNPATFGDDNITGIWWIDETLAPDIVFDLVTNIDYTQTCAATRQAVASSNDASALVQSNLRHFLRVPSREVQQATMMADIQMYPNPTTGKLNIESPMVQGAGTLKVYNQMGQLVMEQQMELLSLTKTNLDALQTGMYLVRIETELGTTTRQLIKR
ncbi:MAG: lamin tail domain-containing protein [Bacteroidota bacterium]